MFQNCPTETETEKEKSFSVEHLYFLYPGHSLVTSLGFILELSGEALGCALLFCVDVG